MAMHIEVLLKKTMEVEDHYYYYEWSW